MSDPIVERLAKTWQALCAHECAGDESACPPRKTISDSAVNSYARCPQAFSYRYHMGLKIAPSFLIVGRAAHEAEEYNYAQKLTTQEDLTLPDVQDMAATSFEKAIGEEEVLWDDGDQKGPAKDRTVLAASTYHQKIAPSIQPILVEEAFEVVLPWGSVLKGRVDVVDSAGAVRDTKHVSYAPKEDDHLYGTQPALYGHAVRQMTGKLPEFMYDYVILGRKDSKNYSPRTLTRSTPVTEHRIKMGLMKIEQVEKAISSGVVYGNASPFNCSTCGFRKLCPWASR